MENEKNCFNCKYFSEYYVKCDNGMFSVLPLKGHCVNRKWTFAQSDKIIAKQKACEFWEDKSIKIEERKISIIGRLKLMQEHLSHIEQILNDDLR